MREAIRVADAVARTLAALGVDHVFGVVGSGNFHVTNELVAQGATFVAARHEMGGAAMADAWSRATGRVSAATVHQGCGLTNALTAITEAAKCRTPLIVLSGDTPPTQQTSNFWIEQDNLVRAVGAVAERIHTPRTAVADTVRAFTVAARERRTVVLSLPIDLQDELVDFDAGQVPALAPVSTTRASAEGVRRLAELLAEADRPVIVGGRGAREAEAQLRELAELAGALLTTSAAGRGLFVADPWHLDVMGGFSTDGAAELIADADLVVSFGASLNRWTTRDGTLLAKATVVQVDDTAAAIGANQPIDLGVVGDAASVASDVLAVLRGLVTGPRTGYRTPSVQERVAASLSWRDQPFEEKREPGRIDPRTLTAALDRILPASRVVIPDGGNFVPYPAMLLDVPDNLGFCLPIAFQAIGMALAAGIGSGVALPERTPVVGIGDGGFMMCLVELDTAVRLGLGLVVVVYDDAAYGAEVHHFATETDRLDIVRFPDTDIAAIARGFGAEAVTVREVGDLDAVRGWVDGPQDRPLVIDAKIASFPSWLLAHVFTAE